MKVLKSGEEQIVFLYGKQTLNGNPYNHTGIDIVRKGNRLDTIVAYQTGKVTKVVKNVKGRNLTKGYGNYVELEHENNVYTRYCHLKYGTIKVKKGEIVNIGQEIGYMGETGYTFGAHLHFEIKKDGKLINPLPYIKGAKKIKGYLDKKQYIKGNYKVIVDVLNVRKGPGKNNSIIKYDKLTKNAKEQILKINKGKVNGYVKNMEFTALKIENMANESWAQTSSGWVCLENFDGIYCEIIK